MRRNRASFCILVLAVLLGFLGSLCRVRVGCRPGTCSGRARREARGSSRVHLLVRAAPRALAAVLAGAAGMLLQSVLCNPLAAPSVIDINSGARLCALICKAFLPSFPRLIPLRPSSARAFSVYCWRA